MRLKKELAMDPKERPDNQADAGETRAGRPGGNWKLYLISALLIAATLVGLGYQHYGRSFGPDLIDAIDDYAPRFVYYLSTRPNRVWQVRGDLRSMATALESYCVDYGSYPTTTPLRYHTTDPELLKTMGGWELATTHPGDGVQLAGLTTPVGYLTGLFMDPLTAPKHLRFYANEKFNTITYDGDGTAPFAYYPTDKGWLLWSPGLDEDYDITDASKVYDDATTAPTPALINLTYDPTNGTGSSGDIFRFKR